MEITEECLVMFYANSCEIQVLHYILMSSGFQLGGTQTRMHAHTHTQACVHAHTHTHKNTYTRHSLPSVGLTAAGRLSQSRVHAAQGCGEKTASMPCSWGIHTNIWVTHRAKESKKKNKKKTHKEMVCLGWASFLHHTFLSLLLYFSLLNCGFTYFFTPSGIVSHQVALLPTNATFLRPFISFLSSLTHRSWLNHTLIPRFRFWSRSRSM